MNFSRLLTAQLRGGSTQGRLERGVERLSKWVDGEGQCECGGHKDGLWAQPVRCRVQLPR